MMMDILDVIIHVIVILEIVEDIALMVEIMIEGILARMKLLI